MVLKINGLVEEMREGLKESTYPSFQLVSTVIVEAGD